MPDYTRVLGKALDLSRKLTPSGVGNTATLKILKHASGRGYQEITTITSNWRAEQDDEIGGIVLEIAESETVTPAMLAAASAFVINGYVYKLILPGGKRPPLGASKKIWRFSLNATQEQAGDIEPPPPSFDSNLGEALSLYLAANVDFAGDVVYEMLLPGISPPNEFTFAISFTLDAVSPSYTYEILAGIRGTETQFFLSALKREDGYIQFYLGVSPDNDEVHRAESGFIYQEGGEFVLIGVYSGITLTLYVKSITGEDNYGLAYDLGVYQTVSEPFRFGDMLIGNLSWLALWNRVITETERGMLVLGGYPF